MRDPYIERAKALHRELDRLLAAGLGDRELRDAIEGLEDRSLLPFVVHRVARGLLERDPILFGPVVRPRLLLWGYDGRGKWHRPWRTAVGKVDLEWLLRFAEERDDAPLFKAAMQLHFDSVAWRKRDALFRKELRSRFHRGLRSAERASLLERFAGLGHLDDASAIELYEAEPNLCKRFILDHVPPVEWDAHDRDRLPKLLDRTRSRDPLFHFALYRTTVGSATWRRDVQSLIEQASDAELDSELERRHPAAPPSKIGDVFALLLEKRGDAATPYVHRHLADTVRGIFGSGGYETLIDLARRRGDERLWAGLLRYVATPKEYNAAVRELVRDLTDGGSSRDRLLLLAGLGRELNFGRFSVARVQPLHDDVACALFDRAPELLDGVFKQHLFAGWHETYPHLLDRVLAAEHEDLLDFLASRFVTRGGFWVNKKLTVAAEKLSRYYEGLRRDPVVFAERSSNVLAQVPPFAIGSYDALLEGNRLARLLYEHAPVDYLASSRAIRDLLESPEIHAQRLAFRALALGLPSARRLAAENIDLLAATLLRPLHRRTRLVAFAALLNAADDEVTAAKVLSVAREAMHLPDLRYPKEELVGLIGRIVHRHAALRNERERNVVYRSA